MRKEQLFSVRKIGLYIVALVVTIFVEEAVQVLLDPGFVVCDLVLWQFHSHLIPYVHELFKFVGSRIFEIESGHFLSHYFLDQLFFS